MRLPIQSLIIATALIGDVRAQPEQNPPIHWAYSAYFGTGHYELGTEEEVFTASVRPRRRWREASIGPDGRRRIGVDLRVPIGIGAHDFAADDLGGTFRLGNVGTVSAVPGVEIEFPVTSRWSLKPIAYAGWGTETHGDASAWIYWTGIKSRLRFHAASFDWSLVNGLTYVGYSSDASERGSVLPLLTGLEFQTPLNGKTIAEHPVHLHWHIAYTKYLNEVEFLSAGGTSPHTVEVGDEWEIGVAFGTGDEPLRLWRLRWDRVGIAYRFSNDGNFTGIGLVFHSLFDR
jgi:hypothetical protein